MASSWTFFFGKFEFEVYSKTGNSNLSWFVLLDSDLVFQHWKWFFAFEFFFEFVECKSSNLERKRKSIEWFRVVTWNVFYTSLKFMAMFDVMKIMAQFFFPMFCKHTPSQDFFLWLLLPPSTNCPGHRRPCLRQRQPYRPPWPSIWTPGLVRMQTSWSAKESVCPRPPRFSTSAEVRFWTPPMSCSTPLPCQVTLLFRCVFRAGFVCMKCTHDCETWHWRPRQSKSIEKPPGIRKCNQILDKHNSAPYHKNEENASWWWRIGR